MKEGTVTRWGFRLERTSDSYRAENPTRRWALYDHRAAPGLVGYVFTAERITYFRTRQHAEIEAQVKGEYRAKLRAEGR